VEPLSHTSRVSAANSALDPDDVLRSSRRRTDGLWEQRLAALLAFQARHGHANVPRGWAEDPKLATWVLNQRRLLRTGILRLDRQRRLEQSGISWAGADERRREQQETWDRMLGALRAYHRLHGHLNVPRGWAAEPTLAGWLATQRFLRKRGDLVEERERRLAELDPEWHRGRDPRVRTGTSRVRESRSQAWDRGFAALERYRQSHGDCAVPTRWPKDGKLARWVVRQRLLRKRGILSRDRVDRLTRLGFEWSGRTRRTALRNQRWMESLAALAEFRRRHGHADVPLGVPEHRSLAVWAQRQRNERRKGRLDPDRVRRLDALRFPWSPGTLSAQDRIDAWERMAAMLAAYSRRHGHIDVPREGASRELSAWLDDQRRRKQIGALAADRVRRLEGLGMWWSLREKRWESQFARLVEYRREHGDCDVPTSPGSDLSRWVSAQRTARRTGRLDRARRARLDDLGFSWRAPARHALAVGR
jgi:hypothetical protein